jgi:hypothetical protein
MAKAPKKIGVGQDFPLEEVPRWRAIASIVFWGVVASLVAAAITWSVAGFAVPEACRQVGSFLQ